MSLRNLLKGFLPHRSHIQKQGGFHLLSDHLHDPELWHLHRRSTAGGAAIGMFCAFIPFPVQTIGSAVFAILFRVNLPVSVLFSLFSNPLTIPPVFYFSYRFGAKLLGLPAQHFDFSFSWDWLSNTLIHIWQPLFLGCFILGTLSATVTYFLIRLIWRVTAVNKWVSRGKTKD